MTIKVGVLGAKGRVGQAIVQGVEAPLAAMIPWSFWPSTAQK